MKHAFFGKRNVQIEDYSKGNIVPIKYSSFLLDMNFICANCSYDFHHGRDKERTRIFDSLCKTQNTNIVLLGDNGVGKNALVENTVNRVINKQCPAELVDHHFIYWDVEKILTIMSLGPSSKTIKSIEDTFEFITSYENIVVVIDQIHLMALSRVLLNYLSILVKVPQVKVIGMTTEDEFYDSFSEEHKILASFDVIPVEEPKPKDVYPMIKDYVKLLGKKHGVCISRDMVEYTVSVSAAFFSEMCNPGLAINFIEKSMIVAKRRKHKKVTKKDINANFNFNYELYNKMSYEDKKITAYHEAGHFIVSKMSENIKNMKTTAITIVPAEYFMGVTMFEFEPEMQTSCDSDYYIDNIASDLAGRVAEKILQGEKSKYTSGAVADLKNATQTARDIVTEFGMIEKCGKNMTYFCNHDLSDLALLSEERKRLIDSATQELIDKAYKRATEILTENRKLLDLIADALLSNEVLDEKDLNRMCELVASET